MTKIPEGTFFIPTTGFFDELSEILKGKKALEVFSGNGLLASELSSRGIAIKATSILSGMDGHSKHMYSDVEDIDAVKAVRKYKCDHDILIFCWATTTVEAFYALITWGFDKPVIFIGERPIIDKPFFLPGCATDEFHDAFRVDYEIKSYTRKNLLDNAVYGHLDTNLFDKVNDKILAGAYRYN